MENDHYYSAKPSARSSPTIMEGHMRGRVFQLTTDHGVFSRKGIDRGSILLANTATIPDGSVVLDLGCGYGPVGIAVAATVPGCTVWMTDINERAVRLSEENARRQGVVTQTHFACGDGVSQIPVEVVFDVILLNPPIRAGKDTVWSLYRQARERLRANGALWIVIQKKQGAQSSETYLRSLFASVSVAARDQGFRILRCTNSR